MIGLGQLLLLILLIVLLLGLPTWPYSREWGYRPTGVTSLLLAILIVLLLLSVVPWGGWTYGPAPGTVVP